MHAAHATSAIPDHASARDAADSTALSLALEDMERRVLGQLEDEQLLSARGLRGERISTQSRPPRPLESSTPASSPPALHMRDTHAGTGSAQSSGHENSMHGRSTHGVGSENPQRFREELQSASSSAALRTAPQQRGGVVHHALNSALLSAGMLLLASCEIAAFVAVSFSAQWQCDCEARGILRLE